MIPEWLPADCHAAWRAMAGLEEIQLEEAMEAARRLRTFRIRDLIQETRCSRAEAKRAISLLGCVRVADGGQVVFRVPDAT